MKAKKTIKELIIDKYPKAYAYWSLWGYESYTIYENDANHSRELGKAPTEEEAWKKAYEFLVDKGELIEQ